MYDSRSAARGERRRRGVLNRRTDVPPSRREATGRRAAPARDAALTSGVPAPDAPSDDATSVSRAGILAPGPRGTSAKTIAPFALGVACLLVYAAPLVDPPASAPIGTVAPPDAWLLARIFPGVPAAWVAIRLVALTAGAILVTRGGAPAMPRSVAAATPKPGRGAWRWIALAVAVLHGCAGRWASQLGPAGQTAYLFFLVVPTLLLTAGTVPSARHGRIGRAGPTLAIIAVWVACRLFTDLGSPRVADVVDGWRGWLDIAGFVAEKRNLLTDLFDPKLPGMGGVLLVLHGVPLVRLGVLPLAFRAVQLCQIASIALCAAGVAVVARYVAGRDAAAIAAAVFLFAPYTRFVTLFPGPFVAGPVYVMLVALCAVRAYAVRSEAAVAALGAAAGIAITLPGAIPSVAFILAATAWTLRDSWRPLWVGAAAGVASFAAVAGPALGTVLDPGALRAHFRWDGLIAIIDGNLLGQLPLGAAPPAWQGVSQRPLDIVASAVLAPFAHPRLAIRLWGDTIFDPVGGALLAVGLVACVRAVLRSGSARALVLLFFAALCPAFASPVDVVDVVHAVALPVPAALLASVGFAVLAAGVRRSWRRAAAAAVAVAVCVGGTVVFDLVNPRILGASSFGIMFQVLDAKSADRAIVLTYGPRFVRPTATLFVGPITAFGGPRPVGYLEYDGGDLPADGFAAEAKDLVFWSHGYDRDMDVPAAICRQWPAATFYEIWDAAGRGRVHAARLGTRPWKPDNAPGRWSTTECAAISDARPSHDRLP